MADTLHIVPSIKTAAMPPKHHGTPPTLSLRLPLRLFQCLQRNTRQSHSIIMSSSWSFLIKLHKHNSSCSYDARAFIEDESFSRPLDAAEVQPLSGFSGQGGFFGDAPHVPSGSNTSQPINRSRLLLLLLKGPPGSTSSIVPLHSCGFC